MILISNGMFISTGFYYVRSPLFFLVYKVDKLFKMPVHILYRFLQ